MPQTFVASSIASLRVHASGMQQKPPQPQNALGENLPSYFGFDRCGSPC